MILDFRLWLLLRENLDATAYDDLFNRELAPCGRCPHRRGPPAVSILAERLDQLHRRCLRNAGFREQGDLEERIHDVIVKLLVSPGGLFRRYDAQRHGPLDLRFKRSVSNAVKNIVEREKNRRRLLPAVSLDADHVPARHQQQDDDTIIDKFRNLLQTRLGDLAVAIFNARLEGRQTKDLVGIPEFDRQVGMWSSGWSKRLKPPPMISPTVQRP